MGQNLKKGTERGNSRLGEPLNEKKKRLGVTPRKRGKRDFIRSGVVANWKKRLSRLKRKRTEKK